MGWTRPLYLGRFLLIREIRPRAQGMRGRLLDVGCGARPYERLFPDVSLYVALDLPSNPRADVHGNGLALPFEGEGFDVVFCSQVLEHVSEPGKLIREFARVLKPGGRLLLTAPQTWGLHCEPNDFYRFTKYGLCYLAESNGFAVVDVAPTCGVWATMAQRAADVLVYTCVGERRRLPKAVVSIVLAPVLVVAYLLDRLLGRWGDTLDHVLLARKGQPI